MDSEVLPATLPVISHASYDHDSELPLLLLVEFLVEEAIVYLRSGRNRLDQLDLVWAQFGEDGLDVGGFQTGVIIIQEWIVDMVVRLEDLRVLTAQLDDPLQMWEEK